MGKEIEVQRLINKARELSMSAEVFLQNYMQDNDPVQLAALYGIRYIISGINDASYKALTLCKDLKEFAPITAHMADVSREDDDPDWVIKPASEIPQEEASETESAKKPYTVGSKEAAEAVERVKQREAELEAERKATRRPGRKKKTAE